MTLLLLFLILRFGEVAPGDDPPLDGGQVAEDGEVDHHDLEPGDHVVADDDVGVTKDACDPLDQRENEAQHHTVGTAEESVIQPLGPDGLSLGTHIGGEKDTDHRKKTYGGVALRWKNT